MTTNGTSDMCTHGRRLGACGVCHDWNRAKPPRPCGCCPTCGALPGHQNPPTHELWQHKHNDGSHAHG